MHLCRGDLWLRPGVLTMEAGSKVDVVLAENADYHGGFRLSDATSYQGLGYGKGYNRLEFSGPDTIGAHDVDDQDPPFVDPSRTPETWDSYLGGDGTLASAMARLKPGGGYQMQQLLDYLREGFRPQNPVFEAAGDPDDGSPDMGAVDMSRDIVAAPTDLVATSISESAIELLWQDRSDAEDGFQIERGLTQAYGDFVSLGNAGQNAEAFTDDTGLSPATRYCFRVRAYRGSQHSAYSYIATALTQGEAGCSGSDERDCYEGPADSAGVGTCETGTQTCEAGSWSRLCSGQVLPRQEECGNKLDDDCDGSADEGCALAVHPRGCDCQGGGGQHALGLGLAVHSWWLRRRRRMTGLHSAGKSGTRLQAGA